MLVLTRKIGEKIRIGNDIEIEVRSVAGKRVRIGINAPREIPIRRPETDARQQTERIEQLVQS